MRNKIYLVAPFRGVYFFVFEKASAALFFSISPHDIITSAFTLPTKHMTNIQIPKHVAIIADGNRRWAKSQGLPTLEGHRRGANNIEDLMNAAKDLGVECLTFWLFSTENWKRTEKEVGYLFDLLRQFAKKQKEKFLREDIRFVHLGRKDRFPEDVSKIIAETEEETRDRNSFTLALALDYGGQDELLRTFSKLKDENLEITTENVESHLDTTGLPLLDLVIRTGDVFRFSGFMSWQVAYAEFYFSEKMFPDFGPEDLKKAIEDFGTRERRFGGDSKK